MAPRDLRHHPKLGRLRNAFCRCTDGEGFKNAIQKMKSVNVMGKEVAFDDHNSAGRFVVLQTVLDKKVGVADIVEVK